MDAIAPTQNHPVTPDLPTANYWEGVPDAGKINGWVIVGNDGKDDGASPKPEQLGSFIIG